MEICLINEETINENSSINYVPCSINFKGKAKVSSYFKENYDIDGAKHASFRGRPLYGCDMKIPKGYCGYVLRKQCDDSEPASNTFNIEQSFMKFTYWNLDKKPTRNDTIASTLDWFDISEALHSKIKPEFKNRNGISSCK